MILELIRLQFLKSVRSTSFAKSLIAGLILGVLAVLLLSYVLLAGLFLGKILEQIAVGQDALQTLNAGIIFYFLAEFIVRYFLQQLPVIELENLLHLPIGKKKIIHMLLVRSFISPLSIIALLLFTPIAVQELKPAFGVSGVIGWLGTLLFLSWSLHWFILWFKQRFEDSLVGVLIVFAVVIVGGGSTYMGWFNLGGFAQPFFELAVHSYIPFVLVACMAIAAYYMAYSYYLKNAYLEDLVKEEELRFLNQNFGFLARFGLAGEMANLEWKLIIRHKKSRTFLMLSVFFLLYGLIFYDNPSYLSEDGGFSNLFIFVGIFITGIFMMNYGQLFLSWNSANFDFYMNKKGGVEALVLGKYLILIAISCLFFLLSIPYVYFGWKFLFIHGATWLFNIGVSIHLMIYISLWKPKPMDLNKGAMFNYEGVGAAQFLMMIPLMGAPYLVFLPLSHYFNDYVGLGGLGIVGVIGLFAFKQLSSINIRRVEAQRYEISSSFRQEI